MAMTPPFVVRPLLPADAEAVHSLARSLGDWFNADGLRQIAVDLTSQSGFVAVERGRIVGFILWKPLDATVADLSWMGVAEAKQRRGIGSALLATLVADLASRGLRSLEVSTVADSEDYEPYVRTRAFYRARGFSDLRVDPGYWGSGAHRYDRLVLLRDLAARH